MCKLALVFQTIFDGKEVKEIVQTENCSISKTILLNFLKYFVSLVVGMECEYRMKCDISYPIV